MEELKQINTIHIGRKCPKGTKEVAGSIHLGKGIWALRCAIVNENEEGINNE